MSLEFWVMLLSDSLDIPHNSSVLVVCKTFSIYLAQKHKVWIVTSHYFVLAALKMNYCVV